MKSLLLFVIGMLEITTTTRAFTTQSQGNWRWRNNDGNESTATWKTTVNTPATLTLSGTPEVLRLRIVVNSSCFNDQVAGYVCPNRTQTDSLQYSTTPNNSLSWVNIGSTTTNKAFRMAGNNVYATQQQPTTEQIDSLRPYTSFTAGVMMVSDSVIQGYSLQASTISESEWVFTPTVNILPNTTYYFRQLGTTRRTGLGYTLPSLTTGGPLPVKLTRFVVTAEDKKAKLEWETAIEQSNHRFEVQRSPDQRTWQTIATVKGRGNTTTPVSYMAYDENPLPGIGYYRLQQFDTDGKSTVSEIRFLRTTGSGAAVSVWPNPVKDVICFSLGNTGAAKVEAMLSDAGGRMIHRQTFASIVANAVNKLSLPQQPAPGLYLLQLKGDGFSESVKIVVQ